MQLTIKSIVGLMLICSFGYAQNSEENINLDSKPVEIDFLLNYYDQDGNHSAVEGGVGTQKLNDAATILVVNVPVYESNNLTFTLGVDNYSSASSDKINPLVSGPSRSDTRTYLNAGYSIANSENTMSYGFNAGFSTESDSEMSINTNSYRCCLHFLSSQSNESACSITNC